MSYTLASEKVPKNQANRFEHIDGLRALAVLLVVFTHAGYTFFPGDSGVTIFFGISGFIITYILLHEREKTNAFNLPRFYFRRAFKLTPPLLIAIVIPTLIYAKFHTINSGTFISQIFFSYNWVRIFSPDHNEILPGSLVVWSLAVEEQFYIVFALIWLLLVRVSWWKQALLFLSVAAIVASTLRRSFLAWNGDITHVLKGTDARLDAIAWGVLVAVLIFMWQRGEANWMVLIGKDWVAWSALGLFLGAMILRDGWIGYAFRPSIQAIAGVLIIAYGMIPADTGLKKLFYRALAWRPIQAIGLASYSIYLVHYPLERLLHLSFSGAPKPVYAFLVSAAGIFSGILIYKFIEIPCLLLRKKIERLAHDRRVQRVSD